MKQDGLEPYIGYDYNSFQKISVRYQRIDNIINSLDSGEKTYYYCICIRKRPLLPSSTCLVILTQNRLKKSNQICMVPNQNFKLTYTNRDHETLAKIHGGIQLGIIQSCQEQKEDIILVKFKGNISEDWKIKFQNKRQRERWFLLIKSKKNLIQHTQINEQSSSKKLKQLKQSQNQSGKDIQSSGTYIQAILQQQNFSIHKKLNQLIKTQFKNVKTVITGLLNESSIDDLDKKHYLYDKLVLFQTNFKILGDEINLIQGQLQEYRQQENQNKIKIPQLQKRIKQAQQKNNQLNKQISILGEEKDRNINQKNREIECYTSEFALEKRKLSEGQYELEDAISRLKQSELSLRKTNQKNELEKLALKETIRTLEQRISSSQNSQKEQCKRYKQKIAESELKIDQLSKKSHKKEQQSLIKIKESAGQVVMLKQEVAKLKNQYFQNEFFHIFQGDVLQRFPFYKQYIREKIEDYTQKHIIRTKILFKFDKLQKINFHAYIDHHPNIILIVKAANGSFLAAYSQDPITPIATANRGGLILSLTNQKTFYLQESKKSVTYDDYYVIFGNSQIRLKSLEQKIFSNFGIANGFFNTNGFKVDILFNEDGNREIDIDSYEIHEIFFKQE